MVAAKDATLGAKHGENASYAGEVLTKSTRGEEIIENIKKLRETYS